MSDYHARIMNIPTESVDSVYKLGHRDARHAAAVIALEAEARVRELEADPRMALTRDDLAVAHRISEREAAAYAPGSITGRVWRRRAERLARAMAVAALAAVGTEGNDT